MSGTTFEARYSKSALVMLFSLSAAILNAGVWALGAFGPPFHSDHAGAGWILVGFGGSFASVFARRLFDDTAQIRISREGIQYKPWSTATIPWEEISGVGAWRVRGSRSILLNLRHPDRFPSRTILGRFAKANRMWTRSDIAISMTALNRSFVQAMKAIHQFREPSDIEHPANLAKLRMAE